MNWHQGHWVQTRLDDVVGYFVEDVATDVSNVHVENYDTSIR